jgi:hypothetical protein
MKRSKPPAGEVKVSFVDSSEMLPAHTVSPASALLVGDVLDSSPLASSGHVIVRWRGTEGLLNECSLPVVKGLAVDNGDLVLLQRPDNWPEWIVTSVVEGRSHQLSPQLEAKVDGKRIEIEGHDEIVLRCGQASITMRRNGRIVIRGTYVETRSKGTNRIKGGVVLIN